MHNVRTAARLRARAFTPGTRSDRKVVRAAVWPAVRANEVGFLIAAAREAGRNQLRVNHAGTLTATVKNAGTPTASSTRAPAVAIAIALAAACLHLGVTSLITFGLALATGGDSAATTIVPLVWLVWPVLPVLWRQTTLHLKTDQVTLRQPDDIDASGFAKHPNIASSPTGTGPSASAQQLALWLTGTTPAHGIAFDYLRNTYRDVATARGTTYQERRIGRAWTMKGRTIGGRTTKCRTIRPALYEVRF